MQLSYHVVFLHESWLFPAFLAPLEENLSVAFVLCFQRGWDSSIVFLFDKSLTKYSGPLTARPLPDSVNFIGETYKCVRVTFFCLYKWLNTASQWCVLWPKEIKGPQFHGASLRAEDADKETVLNCFQVYSLTENLVWLSIYLSLASCDLILVEFCKGLFSLNAYKLDLFSLLIKQMSSWTPSGMANQAIDTTWSKRASRIAWKITCWKWLYLHGF